ncbi:MAG: zinc-binding dehydrogenase [Anaerolineales bacterium]
MKAILLEEHGEAKNLYYGDFPTPEPGRGEVLVELKAAALNRLDIWVRQGWPGIKLEYPHILGADGAGVVAKLGEGVTGWSPGDRVVINANIGCGSCEFCLAGEDNKCVNWNLLGETTRGTYAQYISLPARQLLPLPEHVSFQKAAAAGLVYHAAWHSLIARGNLRPGETVLVVGASGGVNTASIQIAKFTGASVYVIGSSAEKLALAQSLGADHLINRQEEEDWSKAVYQLTGKRGVDVVVDNVGTTFPQSFRAARKGGRILTVGNTGGPTFEIDNRYIFGKHLSLLGSTMGTLNDFATVMNLVYEGKLAVPLDRTYPLPEASKAHQRLEEGRQMGKIVLSIDGA